MEPETVSPALDGSDSLFAISQMKKGSYSAIYLKIKMDACRGICVGLLDLESMCVFSIVIFLFSIFFFIVMPSAYII